MTFSDVLERKFSLLNLIQRSRRIDFEASSKSLDPIFSINSQTFFF